MSAVASFSAAVRLPVRRRSRTVAVGVRCSLAAAPILDHLRMTCATPLSLLRRVADDMASDMRAGLAADGRSDLKMILSYVDSLPTGNEMGMFYALDLGGTNFRVLRVHLGGKDRRVIDTEFDQVAIPQELMYGTTEELFDFIASGLARFVSKESRKFQGRKREIGFTFSFPVKQTSIDSGILIKWTKGFAVSGTAGRDVVACLNEALKRQSLDMRVSALEEKKPEAKAAKPEDVKEDPPKTEPAAAGEKKDAEEAAPPPPPPPPEEVVLHVYMHCECCARKVRHSLKGFEGVEDVRTDCKTHKVVVKGRKAAKDPLKVVERVQKKSGRKVELHNPIPPPKPEPKPEEKKKEEAPPPKVEEKKEVPPVVITVLLKVYMHCQACALAMKKRILKMKGIEEAEPELKTSQVTVKGVFEPAKLVEYIYKKSGKHAVVVKQEPAAKPPEPEEKGKEEAKADTKHEAEAEKKAEGGDKKEKKDEGSPEEAAVAAVEAAITAGKPELRRNSPASQS